MLLVFLTAIRLPQVLDWLIIIVLKRLWIVSVDFPLLLVSVLIIVLVIYFSFWKPHLGFYVGDHYAGVPVIALGRGDVDVSSILIYGSCLAVVPH